MATMRTEQLLLLATMPAHLLAAEHAVGVFPQVGKHCNGWLHPLQAASGLGLSVHLNHSSSGTTVTHTSQHFLQHSSKQQHSSDIKKHT